MKKLLVLFIVFIQLLYGQKILTIASATKNSSYDKLAQSIQSIIEKHTDYKVNVVYTRGSVDNIKRLDMNNVNLAIVQNDTAFYAENGFVPFEKPINNLKMLVAFYNEPIYIVTNKADINSIEQLSGMRVNIGQKKSGLLASSKVLLKTSELLNHITPYYQNVKKSIRYLENEKVQAIFLNTLTDKIKEYITKNRWHIVPISPRLINKVQVTYPYFSVFKIDDNRNTIAVKSILLANNNLNQEMAYTITRLIYNYYEELEFPKQDKNNENCFCLNPIENWHEGTLQFLDEKNITPKLFNADGYFFYAIGAGLLALLVIFFLTIYLVHKVSPKFRIRLGDSYFFNLIKTLYLKMVDHKYIIFIIIVLSLYIVSIFSIKYFEHHWALLHNVYSAFDSFSLKESFLWLFVFATSSYNGGVFPHSDGGKFFASIIPMIGWGGLLAFATLLASDKIKKFLLEVKGMGSIKDENHIVICGWNRNGCNIIKALTHENIEKKHKIVILSEHKDKEDIDLCLLGHTDVLHIVGYAKSRQDLERANVHKADAVVVLQNNAHTDPDAYAILDVLTINTYVKDMGTRQEKGQEFQIIIQIHNDDNRKIALDAGADQIISIANIESNILANMIQTHGINHFVDEVFDYNDKNDIYSIDVTNDSALVGKTYNEALVLLREYNILLLSINIAYHRTEEQMKLIKEKHGLDRDVITNPINDAENSYKIQEGGMLIVLAQYGQTVANAVEELSKRVL